MQFLVCIWLGAVIAPSDAPAAAVRAEECGARLHRRDAGVGRRGNCS